MHEKTKVYEPIHNGFRMVAHAPSHNSVAYKLLTTFYGDPLTTTIDLVLPNQRYELIQCGSLWISTRLTVTPTTDQDAASINAPPGIVSPGFRLESSSFVCSPKCFCLKTRSHSNGKRSDFVTSHR